MIQPINVIEQENKKLFKNGSVYDNITTKRNDYKSKIDNIKIYDERKVTGIDGSYIYPLHLQGFKDKNSVDKLSIQIEYDYYIATAIDLTANVKDLSSTISSTKNDIVKILDDFQKELNTLEQTVISSGEPLVDNVVLIRDKAFEIFLFAFKILYGIFIGFSVCLMGLLTLYAMVKCFLFKIPVHIIWNVIMLVTILTLFIGAIMGILGFVFGSVSPVLAYLLSPNYLNDPKSIFHSTGQAATYLDTCLNGDGNLAKVFNISGSVAQPLEQFYEVAKKINNITSSLPSQSVANQEILKKLQGYKDNLETITDESYGSNQVSTLIQEINSKTDGGSCATSHYYTVKDCKAGYNPQTDFSSNTNDKICYKIQDLPNNFSTNYSCADNERIKKIITYIGNISNSLNQTIDDIKTLKNSSDTVLTDVNIIYKSTGAMALSMTEVVKDALGEDSKLFDMFNCNFLSALLVQFVDQFNNYFAESCKDISLSCMIASFFSYIGVYILLRAMYHYSPDAKKRALEDKEITTTKPKGEKIETETIHIKSKP